jgi:hypothetical protein
MEVRCTCKKGKNEKEIQKEMLKKAQYYSVVCLMSGGRMRHCAALNFVGVHSYCVVSMLRAPRDSRWGPTAPLFRAYRE